MTQPSPLNPVVRAAGQKLSGLLMAQLSIYSHDHIQDAKAINSDLDAICRIIDPMIETIGQYALEHFGGTTTGRAFDDNFKDVLRNALEGNGMFMIEDAAQSRMDDLREMTE